MNHRIVSGVVVFLTLLFCLAAALFAVAMSAAGPDVARGPAQAPIVIHPLDREFTDCRTCHAVSGDNPLPTTHSEFSTATCQTCHRAAVAVAVPHPAGPGTQHQNCLGCHTAGGRMSMLPEGHADYDNDTCLHCHRLASGAAAAPTPVPAGDAARPAQGIPHASSGAYTTCTDCHVVGGSLPMPESHAQYDVATCQDCHGPATDAGLTVPNPAATPSAESTAIPAPKTPSNAP